MNIAIPTEKIDAFEKKFTALNKKIVKCGKKPLCFTYGETFLKKIDFTTHVKGERFKDDIHDIADVEFINIEVNGMEVFKRDEHEYQYIGSISYVDDMKTVYCIDDSYIEYFKDDSRICDHCKTARKRNGYHLFADENGKVIRVGYSCAKEYFGLDVANYLSVCVKTFFLIGSSFKLDIQIRALRFGFVYSILRRVTSDFTRWEKESTMLEFKNLLHSKEGRKTEFVVPEFSIEDIYNYWNNQPMNSGFALNMLEAVKKDYCLDKNAGAFAYAIYSAVYNIRKNNAEKAIANNVADCQFKDGEKPEITGVATHVSTFVNYYGNTPSSVYCIEFKGDDNVYYYMSTSAKGMCDVKTGDKITVKGTINGRKDYRNKKRWVIARPKLLQHNKLCVC